jgi:acetyl-CoA carboxylase biotin carboxyl carrier protein
MTDAEKGGASAEELRSVWEEARELVRRLEGTSIQRLRVEAGDLKIEIEREVVGASPGAAAPAAGVSVAAGDGAAAVEADHRHPVVAPLVGTFYRAAQPGAKPFVEEGDVVDEGQTVAIVEAMKLMNQVTASQGGRVAQILVKDGEWVEFEQVLMLLEPVGD